MLFNTRICRLQEGLAEGIESISSESALSLTLRDVRLGGAAARKTATSAREEMRLHDRSKACRRRAKMVRVL